MPQAQHEEREREYRSRNVVAAVLNETWAMEEGKLDQIRALLEARSSGVQLTEAEIQATMAESAHRGDWVKPLSLIDDTPEDEDMADGRLVVDGVEVLQLFGTLAPRMNLMMRYSGGTSTQKFGMAFDIALCDPNVKTILIEVDSPGGVATGTEELRQKLFSARGVKRVVAVARGMVASAAYYVASAAAELVATPSTEVGSVGVYLVTREVTEASQKAGVKYFVFRAGSLKASGIEYEKLPPERAAALQARIDALYRQFVSAVAENRGVSAATVEQSFGQGTVFLADEAKRRGMIDRVASIEDVLRDERQRAKARSQTTPSVLSPSASELPSVTGLAVSTSACVTMADGSKLSVALPSSAEIVIARSTGDLAHEHSLRKASNMDPKVKAALFARGLIDSLEASDDVCRAALAGHFGGIGKIPSEPARIVESLTGQTTQLLAVEQIAEPLQRVGLSRAEAAHQREMDEARAEAAAAERLRVSEIHSRAEVLRGTGLAVSSEDVAKAVKENLSPDEAAGRWATARASERGINRVEATESEVDKFHAAAIDAIADRYYPQSRRANATQRAPLSAGARELRGSRLIDIARRDLTAFNVPQRPGQTDENVASAWLAMGNQFNVPSSLESAQTASSFPNLLSGLVGKMLDQAIELSDTTYQFWTARMSDLPDLKPQLIVAVGGLNRLDEIGDDDKAPQLKFTEEVPGWIQIGRFANKVGLTPVMVANDDLDAFSQGIAQLGMAHDRTLNTLCLNIITGNVTLLDGYSMFDNTNHLNDITAGSGAAPSAASMNAMRLKHRKQTGINGVGYVSTPPAIALVPSTHETAAEQTFLSMAKIAETLVKQTDATVNVFRGTITPIVEPDLELSSSNVWYTFADPARRRTVVHAYQRGYGRGGRRTSWFDPDTETRYVRLEGRMAAAAAGFRGAVRNAGA